MYPAATVAWARVIYSERLNGLHWAGVGLFFLIGFGQSYSISRLRSIEEVSHGSARIFANYLIGCVCILSLYLFRCGMLIALSWGLAEMLVLAGFYLTCVVRIRPSTVRIRANASI